MDNKKKTDPARLTLTGGRLAGGPFSAEEWNQLPPKARTMCLAWMALDPFVRAFIRAGLDEQDSFAELKKAGGTNAPGALLARSRDAQAETVDARSALADQAADVFGAVEGSGDPLPELVKLNATGRRLLGQEAALWKRRAGGAPPRRKRGPAAAPSPRRKGGGR
jgi:hypothetical protein